MNQQSLCRGQHHYVLMAGFRAAIMRAAEKFQWRKL